MKRLIVAGAVLALATGCAAGAGAVVGAALVGIGVVTHECYQYAQITVIDGATGKKTCDAEVKAIEDGDEEVLGSCYHAPLTPGKWTLRAELPGRPAAVTSFQVPDREGCDPAVSSVVLTIPAPGGRAAPQPWLQPPPPAPATVPPPPATVPPPPTTAPAPAEAPAAAPEAPAPASAAPPVEPAPPAPAPAATPSGEPPPAPPAPPTQSFPD